jgi:hypothetical protein
MAAAEHRKDEDKEDDEDEEDDDKDDNEDDAGMKRNETAVEDEDSSLSLIS